MKQLDKVTFLVDKEFKNYTDLSCSFLRAFQANGYECDVVAFNATLRWYKLVSEIPVWRRLHLRKLQRRVLNSIEKSNSDLVFVVKGYFLMPDTIEKIKGLGKRVVCYHPDDPFNKEFGATTFFTLPSIKHYDAYFTWHKNLLDKIEDMGCSNVFYIPFAADMDIIKPLPSNSESKMLYDVSFIGNADAERIRIIKEIASHLNGTTDRTFKLALFGNGWTGIEGFDCKGVIQGDEYLSAMHRTRININILRNQNKGAHNMRTFEIPAAGGFMLHEYSEEAAGFFREGEEAEYFRDAREGAEKIRYYLNNEPERARIAKSAYNKLISSDYSYRRLSDIIMENLNSVKR